MSLINDALKTAQRERAGQVPSRSGGQPLLDGFFPYVSTPTPAARSSRGRIVLGSIFAVVILATVAWFGVPAIKRAMGKPSKVPSIVLSPSQAAVAPTTPSVQTAQTADTQIAAVAAPESVSGPMVDRAPRPRSSGAKERNPSAGESRSVVTATDPIGVRRDTAIAQPSALLPSAPERRGSISASANRPNFEAEAVAAFNAGDYVTARSRFESAVRAEPTASAWTNYGVTLEKLGDPQAAARAYRSAMAIDPNYFNAWLYLARVYNFLGDVTQAVPLFNRALEIEPNNSDVNSDLAELEFKASAFTEARRYAAVAARTNPSNARAHYYLALSADTLKDRTVARRAFEDYLRTIAGQEKDNLPSVGYARVRLQQLKGNP